MYNLETIKIIPILYRSMKINLHYNSNYKKYAKGNIVKKYVRKIRSNCKYVLKYNFLVGILTRTLHFYNRIALYLEENES